MASFLVLAACVSIPDSSVNASESNGPTALSESKKEPPQNASLEKRIPLVKAYQRADVRPLGKSPKYGNASFRVNTFIVFHDIPSSSQMDALFRNRAPKDVLVYAVRGEWTTLAMQCDVSLLDGGEWIADNFSFQPVAQKPDYPLERIGGGQ